jgi:ZIP family zinc transporter
MLIPLLLSLVAGLTTLIGGLMVVFLKKLKPIYLSISLGFAAGVMIFMHKNSQF